MISDRVRRALGVVAVTAALYASALAFGFVVFAATMKLGVLASLDILFYRGLVALALAFALSLPLVGLAARRMPGLGWRDGWSACVFALSINLCILIVLPVTIDRSISIFILGAMAAHPDDAYSAGRMQDVFEATYLGRYAQITRRLDEQARSGNVRRTATGYAITPQGQAFVRLCRAVAWLFAADPRFVEGS